MARRKMIHVRVDDDLYRMAWAIASRRFTNPTRNLSTIVNEALREYVERHLRASKRGRRKKT